MRETSKTKVIATSSADSDAPVDSGAGKWFGLLLGVVFQFSLLSTSWIIDQQQSECPHFQVDQAHLKAFSNIWPLKSFLQCLTFLIVLSKLHYGIVVVDDDAVPNTSTTNKTNAGLFLEFLQQSFLVSSAFGVSCSWIIFDCLLRNPVGWLGLSLMLLCAAGPLGWQMYNFQPRTWMIAPAKNTENRLDLYNEQQQDSIINNTIANMRWIAFLTALLGVVMGTLAVDIGLGGHYLAIHKEDCSTTTSAGHDWQPMLLKHFWTLIPTLSVLVAGLLLKRLAANICDDAQQASTTPSEPIVAPRLKHHAFLAGALFGFLGSWILTCTIRGKVFSTGGHIGLLLALIAFWGAKLETARSHHNNDRLHHNTDNVCHAKEDSLSALLPSTV